MSLARHAAQCVQQQSGRGVAAGTKPRDRLCSGARKLTTWRPAVLVSALQTVADAGGHPAVGDGAKWVVLSGTAEGESGFSSLLQITHNNTRSNRGEGGRRREIER